MAAMVQATSNANFLSLGGVSVHEINDPEYQRYRRCWIENPAHFIVWEFPLHLDVEITNRCNLRCTFCDKLPLLDKSMIGDMDYKLYRRIIDEGVENRLWGLKLSYRGESLLHPKVVEMVDYAKKRGILDVYFNTNGTLLTRGKCLRLIQAGLDRISVSVEGTDPVAFERERIGAKFYKILNNIDNLLELRQRENVSHPKIRIQTVRLPGIDLVEYKNFWESHCDEVAVVDFKDTKNRKLGMVHNNWACPQLWQRMTIEWNGAIMPCNNDDYRLLSPGNVKTKTVSSSWHDPMVNRARDLHRSGQSHLLKACDGCPWRTTQLNKIGLPQ